MTVRKIANKSIQDSEKRTLSIMRFFSETQRMSKGVVLCVEKREARGVSNKHREADNSALCNGHSDAVPMCHGIREKMKPEPGILMVK